MTVPSKKPSLSVPSKKIYDGFVTPGPSAYGKSWTGPTYGNQLFVMLLSHLFTQRAPRFLTVPTLPPHSSPLLSDPFSLTSRFSHYSLVYILAYVSLKSSPLSPPPPCSSLWPASQHARPDRRTLQASQSHGEKAIPPLFLRNSTVDTRDSSQPAVMLICTDKYNSVDLVSQTKIGSIWPLQELRERSPQPEEA